MNDKTEKREVLKADIAGIALCGLNNTKDGLHDSACEEIITLVEQALSDKDTVTIPKWQFDHYKKCHQRLQYIEPNKWMPTIPTQE